MNILVLSAGTRNKVLQYFKKNMEPDDRLIATDCSNLAPAVYEADQFYLVPRIDDPAYLDCILDICRKESINGVFSLIDPELNLLADNRDRFLEIGVVPIVSGKEVVEQCFDKMKMFHLLNKLTLPTAKCYSNPTSFFKAKEEGKISYPVFVKPIKGSASLNINKVNSDEEVNLLFGLHDGLLIQEYMDGQEIGADVYIDMLSGECVSIFTKKKIRMRAGETDKAISFKDPKLFGLIEKFVSQLDFRGVIDIDLFDIAGEYYISEVNPRFGGGYPHAYHCGMNIPQMILRNLKGIPNPRQIGEYASGICMMKYNEVYFKETEETD